MALDTSEQIRARLRRAGTRPQQGQLLLLDTINAAVQFNLTGNSNECEVWLTLTDPVTREWIRCESHRCAWSTDTHLAALPHVRDLLNDARGRLLAF
jgi:hypothetical protein